MRPVSDSPIGGAAWQPQNVETSSQSPSSQGIHGREYTHVQLRDAYKNTGVEFGPSAPEFNPTSIEAREEQLKEMKPFQKTMAKAADAVVNVLKQIVNWLFIQTHNEEWDTNVSLRPTKNDQKDTHNRVVRERKLLLIDLAHNNASKNIDQYLNENDGKNYKVPDEARELSKKYRQFPRALTDNFKDNVRVYLESGRERMMDTRPGVVYGETVLQAGLALGDPAAIKAKQIMRQSEDQMVASIYDRQRT